MFGLEIKPPYYGGEYSPEISEINEIDFDITMMEKAGFNAVRIGENSWNIIEKNKGNFDFSFYHIIIKKLLKKNIGVVFSLPVFSPPLWLESECSGFHSEENVFCPSDANYINSALYMLKKILNEFSEYKNILFWNISVPKMKDCFCDDCMKSFSEYLSDKYQKSIEKLNFSVNNSAEEAFYSSFDEIAKKGKDALLNPHLAMEWHNFRINTTVSLLKITKNIIKDESNKPFGASFYYDTPSLWKLVEVSDVPAVNYDYYKKDKYLPFFMSYFSNIKLKKYFAIASFENSKDNPIERKESGFHRFRALFPYLTGADGSLYWFFRNHHCGSKTECDALLSSEGRPTIHCGDAVNLGEDIKKAAEFLDNTRAFGSVALQYSSFSKRFFEIHQNFKISDYDSLLIENFYEPIRRKGLFVDIIEGGTDLSDYKVLFSPMAVTFEDGIKIKEIEKWVKDGGIWVCGPLSDIRNSSGIKYKRNPFGNIESLANAYLFHRLYSKKPMMAYWNDGKPFEGFLWYDIFESSENDVVVMADEYKEFSKKSLVKICDFGKGKIILLGTFPSFSDMEKIVETAIGFSKVTKFRCSENIYFSYRSGYDDFGKSFKGLVLAECKGKIGTVRLQKAYIDVLSGKMMKGIIKVEPYGIYILEEISDK